MEQFFTTEYFVTKYTMAILPVSTITGYKSLIMEPGKMIYCTKSPNRILNMACMQSGVSLEGRREATGEILGTNKKIPIPVRPEKGIYMLPTTGIKKKDCMYIAYWHIKEISEPNFQTEIEFKDGYVLQINTSLKSFKLVINRTATIIVYLNKEDLFERSSLTNKLYGKTLHPDYLLNNF